MTRARIPFCLLPFAFCLATLRADAPPAPLYTNNFDALPEGEVPKDILILNGEFTIKKIGDNTVLQLAADPLDTMGALVGPADKNEYTVTARIQSASTGKRFPEFGLGACGPGQVRLWLMPAVGELQLIHGDDVKRAARYDWKSGDWTRFKLQVTKSPDGKFKIQGKAWPDGKPEPQDWTLTTQAEEPPPPGRACLLSTPYSGTPTNFDDVVVTP